MGLKAFASYNTSIKYIRAYADRNEGKKLWKKETGYHLRSRVEAYFASFKRTFGRYFVAKSDNKRITEMIIKVNILNLLKKNFILLSSKLASP